MTVQERNVDKSTFLLFRNFAMEVFCSKRELRWLKRLLEIKGKEVEYDANRRKSQDLTGKEGSEPNQSNQSSRLIVEPHH